MFGRIGGWWNWPEKKPLVIEVHVNVSPIHIITGSGDVPRSAEKPTSIPSGVPVISDEDRISGILSRFKDGRGIAADFGTENK